MVVDPEMLLQLAHRVAESSAEAKRRSQRAGGMAPHAYVDAWKSVNGRPFAPWLDASVDVSDAEPPTEAWMRRPLDVAAIPGVERAMEVRLPAVYLQVIMPW